MEEVLNLRGNKIPNAKVFIPVDEVFLSSANTNEITNYQQVIKEYKSLLNFFAV